MGSIPTSFPRRIAVIDALRGFALLGVLIANVPFPKEASINTGFDQFLIFLYVLLIDTKFITIFTMLLGLGFFIQWRKAQEKQLPFVRYFVVRMLLLFLIGSVHGLLIWNGDILRAYALGGLILLLVRKWPKKRLLTTAILFVTLLTGFAFIGHQIMGWTYSYDFTLNQEHYLTTSFSRYLEVNFITDPWSNFRIDMPITLFFTFGSMLIGFLLGKIGYFTQPEKWHSLSRKFILIGGTAGLAASYLFQQVVSGSLELTPELIWLPVVVSGGMFMQSLMYVALFTWLFQRTGFKRFMNLFKPVGRTSLSNYLLQSVFFLLVFLPCLPPLRLFGTISASTTWLIALLFFLFQSLGSWLWLKKWKQGPVEFLWKRSSAAMIKKQNTREATLNRVTSL